MSIGWFQYQDKIKIKKSDESVKKNSLTIFFIPVTVIYHYGTQCHSMRAQIHIRT